MRKWVEYRPSSNLGLASVRWYTLRRVTSLPGCGYQDNSAFLVSAESWCFPFIELGFGTAGLGAVLNERGSLNGLGVPPCWRAYFLLLRQKKVAKEKATPRSAPLRGSLRYSTHRAACLNSPAAQTRQADGPRSACVAQRLSRGPKKRPHSTDERLKVHSCGQPGKRPKNEGSVASLTRTQAQPSHSRAGGNPCAAWALSCAGVTVGLFEHGRLTGPLERC